jgi:ketol-acid reductoisomerase
VERIYTDEDAKGEALKGATIAVIGYGSQGRAHARNLRDSGYLVIVGARAGGGAENRALADGFRVVSPAEAAREAQFVCLLTPDMSHREVYAREIEPNLKAGDTLLVAHGFSVLYGVV